MKTCGFCGWRNAFGVAPHPDRPKCQVAVCLTCAPDQQETAPVSRRTASIAERVITLLPTLDQVTSAIVAARLSVTEHSAQKILRQLARAGVLVTRSAASGQSGHHVYARRGVA